MGLSERVGLGVNMVDPGQLTNDFLDEYAHTSRGEDESIFASVFDRAPGITYSEEERDLARKILAREWERSGMKGALSRGLREDQRPAPIEPHPADDWNDAGLLRDVMA